MIRSNNTMDLDRTAKRRRDGDDTRVDLEIETLETPTAKTKPTRYQHHHRQRAIEMQTTRSAPPHERGCSARLRKATGNGISGWLATTTSES
jgi:hypothetical protein